MAPPSRRIAAIFRAYLSGHRIGERKVAAMQMIQSGYRGFSLVFDLGLDRILIPLAIVLGLAGGAMIGAELARFQTPETQFMH